MRKNKDVLFYKSELCIFCGQEVPEGRMICPNCETGDYNKKSDTHLFIPSLGGSKARIRKSEEIMKKALSIIKTTIIWLVVALAVFMMIFTVISVTTFNRSDRNLFGYRAYIVNTDSMSATDFDAGDLIFVKEPDPETLKEGDIITYISQNSESFGETITHKIRKKTTDAEGNAGFITYGTTTDTDDETVVTYPYILGKYEGHIANLGTFFNFLKTPRGYIVCIFVPFMLLILYQGINCIRLFRRYKREQTEKMQEEKKRLEDERKENEKVLAELQALKARLESQQSASDNAQPDNTDTE